VSFGTRPARGHPRPSIAITHRICAALAHRAATPCPVRTAACHARHAWPRYFPREWDCL